MPVVVAVLTPSLLNLNLNLLSEVGLESSRLIVLADFSVHTDTSEDKPIHPLREPIPAGWRWGAWT